MLDLPLLVLARELNPDDFTTPLAELTLSQIMQQLPDPDGDVHERVVVSIEVARLRRFMRALPMLERRVLVARYGLVGRPLTCRQIATQLGLSRRNVSTIEQRALDRLRSMYGLPRTA